MEYYSTIKKNKIMPFVVKDERGVWLVAANLLVLELFVLSAIYIGQVRIFL